MEEPIKQIAEVKWVVLRGCRKGYGLNKSPDCGSPLHVTFVQADQINNHDPSSLTETLWVLVTYRFVKAFPWSLAFFLHGASWKPHIDMEFDRNPYNFLMFCTKNSQTRNQVSRVCSVHKLFNVKGLTAARKHLSNKYNEYGGVRSTSNSGFDTDLRLLQIFQDSQSV